MTAGWTQHGINHCSAPANPHYSPLFTFITLSSSTYSRHTPVHTHTERPSLSSARPPTFSPPHPSPPSSSTFLPSSQPNLSPRVHLLQNTPARHHQPMRSWPLHMLLMMVLNEKKQNTASLPCTVSWHQYTLAEFYEDETSTRQHSLLSTSCKL